MVLWGSYAVAEDVIGISPGKLVVTIQKDIPEEYAVTLQRTNISKKQNFDVVVHGEGAGAIKNIPQSLVFTIGEHEKKLRFTLNAKNSSLGEHEARIDFKPQDGAGSSGSINGTKVKLVLSERVIFTVVSKKPTIVDLEVMPQLYKDVGIHNLALDRVVYALGDTMQLSWEFENKSDVMLKNIKYDILLKMEGRVVHSYTGKEAGAVEAGKFISENFIFTLPATQPKGLYKAILSVGATSEEKIFNISSRIWYSLFREFLTQVMSRLFKAMQLL